MIQISPSWHVLLISDSALGDLVCSTPVIKAVLDKTQNVYLRIRPDLSDFLPLLPGVQPEHQAPPSVDLIIDLTSSSATRRLCAKRSAKFKLGRCPNLWSWFKFRRTYTYLVAKNPNDQIVRDFEPLLAMIGAKPELPQLQKSIRGEVRPVDVVLHCGAGHPLRVLPLPLIVDIVRAVLDRGQTIRLVGTEIEIIEKIRAHFPQNQCVFTESLTLTQLASACAQAKEFIGPDSGPLHLAAALGTKCVGIYGPNTPERAGPLQNHVRFLEKSFPCRPCDQNRPCPYDVRCLKSLTLTDYLQLSP